ncbi:phospholipase A1-II 1-like [Bidens hawaiensis]|uniref:phospholipase A1-II 1-like n=1 Tax=Bidens hawaiensis TaxID=980011 RepID=UPI00404B544F
MGSNWKKLSGEDEWSNLLDPLDVNLRRYIIHYGEMAQAARDAFNSEKVSKHAGDCLYKPSHLLSKVQIEQGNPYKYKVTKYLYGTSAVDLPSFLVKSLSREAWSKESNWIGYVAVATDEGKEALGRRDIVVAWRGTVQTLEWINDLKFDKVAAPDIFKGDENVKIQRGWHSIYTTSDPKSKFNKSCVRDQVLEEVRRLVDLHKNEEVSLTIVGHSMGAALATLNAVDIVVNGYNKPTDPSCEAFLVTAFVFASPRVGNSSFKNMFTSLGDKIRVLRIENANDVVPHYPLKLQVMCFPINIGYSHVGKVLRIDTSKSPYLKQPGDIQRWHDMETYLHGVAGTQGDEGKFDLVVTRSIALVNKYSDGLNDDCHVPAKWWVEKNKGMVRFDDGVWLLIDHEDYDVGTSSGGGGDGDDNGDEEIVVIE